jgi:hypothetical protein
MGRWNNSRPFLEKKFSEWWDAKYWDRVPDPSVHRRVNRADAMWIFFVGANAERDRKDRMLRQIRRAAK